MGKIYKYKGCETNMRKTLNRGQLHSNCTHLTPSYDRSLRGAVGALRQHLHRHKGLARPIAVVRYLLEADCEVVGLSSPGGRIEADRRGGISWAMECTMLSVQRLESERRRRKLLLKSGHHGVVALLQKPTHVQRIMEGPKPWSACWGSMTGTMAGVSC